MARLSIVFGLVQAQITLQSGRGQGVNWEKNWEKSGGVRYAPPMYRRTQFYQAPAVEQIIERPYPLNPQFIAPGWNGPLAQPAFFDGGLEAGFEPNWFGQPQLMSADVSDALTRDVLAADLRRGIPSDLFVTNFERDLIQDPVRNSALDQLAFRAARGMPPVLSPAGPFTPGAPVDPARPRRVWDRETVVELLSAGN